MADYVSGEEETCYCGLPLSEHLGARKDTPRADYVSGDATCGAPSPPGMILCGKTSGHDGDHRNAYSTVNWPNGAGRLYSTAMATAQVAKQLTGLQRKVRAQANQINKLEELRRAAVDKQPEYQKLIGQLEAQASLTTRENALRRQVETERDSERERRFVDRFYRLAALLTDDTAGETWDTLLQRVADLKAELEVERVRANARKAELDKLNVRLTDPFDPRMFLGPSAEYGTTPLAAHVAELAKRVNELEHETVRRCETWNSGTRCVGYAGHMGAHHAGPGTERWA